MHMQQDECPQRLVATVDVRNLETLKWGFMRPHPTKPALPP